MHSDRAFVLCHYRYDPLDRLVGTSPSGQSPLQRFYCKTRLATEIQGLLRHTIVQHDDQLLAQQQRNGEHMEATLLATDQQRSVLHALSAGARHPIAYSPYGHHPADSGLLSVLGFHGERRDPVTGHYVLGNGYRAFNPVLMRFNCPDSWSPFGKGGLNAYAYCFADPVNLDDRDGHGPGFIAKWLAKLGIEPRGSLMARSQSQMQLLNRSESTLSRTSSVSRDSIVSIAKETAETRPSTPPPTLPPKPTSSMGNSQTTHRHVTLSTYQKSLEQNKAAFTREMHLSNGRKSYAEKSKTLIASVDRAKELTARPAPTGQLSLYSDKTMHSFEEVLSNVDELTDAWRITNDHQYLPRKLRRGS
ncbi:RHS repeat-associated core domain-containing protein [Pseudomonas sp. Irchel s3h17]|uniref:RHS repeat-associated core domain-containing protein n=1 Tax=Pseudomonas sp. Irchel s3h17 TaxID=2009182 RepID=UPI000BA30BE4|nr:RHS repeat-associated core domain-containing protein [Pseudomonas sp. Irchel s3h17]